MATKTVDNGGLSDFTVATNSGAKDDDTQRMILASDDPAVVLLATIDADTGTIASNTTTLAGAVVATSGVPTGSDAGLVVQFIRDDALTALSVTDGDWTPARVDANGALWVQLAGALAAATDSIAIGSLAGQGWDETQFLDVDESEDQVKGSAGTLHSIIAVNRSAGERFLKVYDGTAASVTVGSTTPFRTVPLAAGTGFVWESSMGKACATGITIAATTGIAVADTGAPGANDVVVNVGFK